LTSLHTNRHLTYDEIEKYTPIRLCSDLLYFKCYDLLFIQAEVVINSSTGQYYEVSKDGAVKELETASITLNDCLACRYGYDCFSS
jgi:hypothetical protein